MLIACRPSAAYFAIICASYFCSSLAFAQKVEIGVDNIPGQTPGVPLSLSANVSSDAVAATLRVNVLPASLTTEQQKCADLLDIGKNDFDSVFKNAVSSLRADFALTEARSKDTLEKSWETALKAASDGSKLNLDFGAAKSYVPLISDESISVRDAKFDAVTTGAQRYLIKSFERVAAVNLKQDLNSFNSSGVTRFTSDNQAIVCFAILVTSFSLEIRFNGRTFDRVSRTPLLDRDCFVDTLKAVAESFRRKKLKAEDIKDLPSFAFLVGIHGARIKRSYGLLSGSELNRFCSVSNEDAVEDPDIVNEWNKANRIWFEAAKAADSLVTPVSDMTKFDQVGYRITRTPTNIWYQYSTRIEGISK